MRKIKIITDSTCDLPEKLVNENEIEVMSLIVNVGGKEYLDRSELNGEMLFEKMKETEEFPTTSQITPNRFYEKFKDAIDEGYDILCITLSSKMSGTNQSANIAKGMMEGFEDRIVVIDSLNVTVGMGLLVLKACKLREEGKTLSEIEDTIIEAIPKVRSSLYFNSLESLIKGGRISKAAGAIGTVLGIKPILCVEKGEMKVREKVRGSKKAIKSLIEFVVNCKIDQSVPAVIVKTGDEKIKEIIKHEYSKLSDNYIESTVGCIVGVHSGPEAAGIFFIEK